MVESSMKVKIDKEIGTVTFLNLTDNVLFRESAQDRTIKPSSKQGIKIFSCFNLFLKKRQ